jgi:acyl-CoA dehydrogenase family member 9
VVNHSPYLSPIKGFFLGRLIEESLFPLHPHPAAERDTLRLVSESVEKFMHGQHESFRSFDEAGAASPEFIQALRELGLFGLIIPEEFEGLGLSSRGYARILQQITLHDGSTALTVGAHSSIGMKALLLFGSSEQKAKYLPPLASGEMIAGFCLTEAQAGSDASSLKTRAVKQADGGWILNGEKIWITNGPIAQFFTVFARTGDDSPKGISAFLVEKSWSGVHTGQKEEKLGIRASATSTVAFQDVLLPPESLIGVEGQGFKIAVAVLNNGRSGLGGGCVGAMKRCIKLACEHAQERKQFGESIGSFGIIREKIAKMSSLCYASESMVQLVGQDIDEDVEDYSVEAAATKVFTTESLWYCAYEALQIAGGNGFMKEYPYEIITRDSRINTIFEGTNEILRLYIGLRSLEELGRYFKELQSSLGDFFSSPQEGMSALSGYVMNKIAHYSPIGVGIPKGTPEVYHSEARVLSGNVRAMGRCAELLIRRHGKNIKNKQVAVSNLSDAAINLYASYCVLARTVLVDPKDSCAQSLIKYTVEFLEKRTSDSLESAVTKNESDSDNIGKQIIERGGFSWDITEEGV